MTDWMIGDSDDCVSIVTEAANPSGGAHLRVGAGIKASSPPTTPEPRRREETPACDVASSPPLQPDEASSLLPDKPETSRKNTKKVTWKDDNLETCHYRRLRGARGTLVRSKLKMCGGRQTRFYTIGFYDMESGREEYASFSQKQLISDTGTLPDVDTSVIFDALRMMDTSVLCDGIRHTWIAENVRVITKRSTTNHEQDPCRAPSEDADSVIEE